MPVTGRLKIAKKGLEKKAKNRLSISKKRDSTDRAPRAVRYGGITLGEDRVRVDRDRGYGGKRKEGRERNRGEKTLAGKKGVLSALMRIKEELDNRKSSVTKKAAKFGKISDIERVWINTTVEHSHVPRRWGKPERGVMRVVFNRHPDTQEFISLMKWAIENWSFVCCGSSFKWMKKSAPPDTPDPRFFARFHEVFSKARRANRERKFTLEDDTTEIARKFEKNLKKAAKQPPKVKTVEVKLRRNDLGGSGTFDTKPNKFVWKEKDD